MSDDPPCQSQPENEMQFPDCQKCLFVYVSGGDSKRFLQAADQSLSDGSAGENPLNVNGTKMFPPEIRYVCVEQRGLEAEYRVFYGLRDSKIPMYVFHGLQPIEEVAKSHGLKTLKENEEMTDFIIVTDKLVVALEVKAFSEGSEKMFRDRLKKSFVQLERLRDDVKMFLEAHNCKVSNDDELPVETFSLFPLADRSRHSPYIEEKDRDRVLFGDEYIKKLQKIITQDIVDKRKRQQQLRILLAWFYGTYSYENLSVRQTIDGPTGKTTKQVGGVFLSRDQLEIRDCKQNYLGIIGFPGTGKTYCLVAKLVKDITGKLREKKKQKRDGKIEDWNGKRDEKILVIHKLKSTVSFIRFLFWKSLGQRKFSVEDLREVKGIVEFWTEKKLESKCESLKKNDYRLKVFFDDYPYTQESASLLRSLSKKIDFLWHTSYSLAPFSYSACAVHPFCRWKVDGDYLCYRDKYAFLDKAVRFTAHIYSLVETICKCFLEDDKTSGFFQNRFGPYMKSSYRYATGTRVVGNKVKFVRVTDKAKEKQKSNFMSREILSLLSLTLLDELRKQLKKFEPKNILVIPGLELSTETGKKRSFRKVLGSMDDGGFKGVTVADYWEVRGQEKECVIVVCDNLDHFMFPQMILDAITRAISKLVLVYRPTETMRGIPWCTEGRIPTVHSPAEKSRESVLKEVEPLSITQLLEGDTFREFSDNLHDPLDPCVTEQEKKSGLAIMCNLSCTDKIFNKILIVKDPSESFICLKKACYFDLLFDEIDFCKHKLEYDPLAHEEFHERLNYLLGVLLKWMKNIEKEPGLETGVFSSLFIQYRHIVRTFREKFRYALESYWDANGNTQETRKLPQNREIVFSI